MQRSYRTPKGTELPLLNLRGREYLEVKYRLVWFREDHPDWAIETKLLSVTDNSAYCKAVIKDEQGRVIATSHKFENAKGFPDFIEKSETGAIGRALALIGYGTQFCADELDEGKRIVDAPMEPRSQSKAPQRPASREAAPAPRAEAARTPAAAPASQAQAPSKEAARTEASGGRDFNGDVGDYEISFGKKYKGQKLRDIPRDELEGYVEWLEENASAKGVPLSEEARFLKVAVGRFLQGGQAEGARNAKSSATANRGGARASGRH